MRLYLLTSDAPDLPQSAFRKSFLGNRPATLEGGKGGSAPAAPDPYQTAAATTQSNQQTAAFNKTLNLNNFSNPFASQQSQQVGTDPATGAPIYNTIISPNATVGNQLDQLMGQIGQSNGVTQNALSGLYGLQNNLSNIGYAYNALSPQYAQLSQGLNSSAAQNAQQQGQNAAYAAQTQYLDPQFSQQKESLDAQLANQGLTPGSQAYNNAMLNFNNQKQQAYSNAQNQAIMTGSQIGTQNWQNQLAGAQTQAGLLDRQAGMLGQLSGLNSQAAGLYGQQAGLGQVPYSNLQSLASLIPGYSGNATSTAAAADIAGNINNAYQGQLASHNADVQSANSTTGTIAGLAGIAAMAFF